MEIEAKFRLTDEGVVARLFAMDRIGPYALQADAKPEIQRNIYYDTDDGRIRRSQWSMRIRELDGLRIATVKGPTRVIGAIHSRDEWEVEIGADAAPSSWPASEARTRALALASDAPLQPIVEVRTVRRCIHALIDGAPLAELALDEGTIHAGARSTAFRELEIESKTPDRAADFEALVRTLEAELLLVPEPKSKFARGLELLEEST